MAHMPINRVLPLAMALAMTSFGSAHAGDGNLFPPEIVPRAAKLNPLPDPCMQEFTRLRGIAERDGLAFLKAAHEHRGSPDEMCRLVGRRVRSETEMVRYVEMQGANCGVLVQSAVRFIQTQSTAESLQQMVCAGDDNWMARLPPAEPDANESHDQ